MKKKGEFGFGQSVRKLHENYGKVLFDETYFEESNINRKPLIWSQNKIITKFQQKNVRVLFMEKCTETAQKLRKKCYFIKLTLKRVI